AAASIALSSLTIRRKRLSITARVGGDMACNSAKNRFHGSFSERPERMTRRIQKSLSNGHRHSFTHQPNFLQPHESRNGHFEGRLSKGDNLATKVAPAWTI